jgi:hypothetical protein
MSRRSLFVGIIFFMHKHTGLQLMSNLALTMTYASIIIKIQPYSDKFTNRIQVFNEICVINTTIILMWLSTHGIDEVEIKSYIGWFYILVSSLGIMVNFCILGSNVLKSLPYTITTLIEKVKDM